MRGIFNLILQKYFKVMTVGIQNELEYRFNFFVKILFSFIPLLTSILVWFAIANYSESKYGYTMKEIVTYYFIMSIVSNLVESGNAENTANDIRTGDLNKYLIKNINYMAYRFFLDVPRRIIFILVAIIPFSVLGYFFKDFLAIHADLNTILYFILSLVLGYIINFFINFLLSIYSFYFSEVTSLFTSYAVLRNIISGNVFPLNILPKYVYQVLIITPFSFIGYFPTSILLNKFNQKDIVYLLLLGVGWIILLFVLCKLIWRAGLKRYSAFGG